MRHSILHTSQRYLLVQAVDSPSDLMLASKYLAQYTLYANFMTESGNSDTMIKYSLVLEIGT